MLKLEKVSTDMADEVYELQHEAFLPLLNKYHDYNTNPAMETSAVIKEKMKVPNTTAFVFNLDNKKIGWVRVTKMEGNTCKISALCILPEYQNKGIGQEIMKLIEKEYSYIHNWVLSTIYEEQRSRHFYEKLGYISIGQPQKVNEKMSIIEYVKFKNK